GYGSPQLIQTMISRIGFSASVVGGCHRLSRAIVRADSAFIRCVQSGLVFFLGCTSLVNSLAVSVKSLTVRILCRRDLGELIVHRVYGLVDIFLGGAARSEQCSHNYYSSDWNRLLHR